MLKVNYNLLQLVTPSHNEKYNSNDNGVVPCLTSTPYPGPIPTISHWFLHEITWVALAASCERSWTQVPSWPRHWQKKLVQLTWTRSQAVARIADCTASHHLCTAPTSGYVTSSVTWPFDMPYVISDWWSFGTKPLSLTVSEIFNVKCNAVVDITVIRPLNKGQGHSFWYQSISYMRLPIGCQ